MIKQANNLEKNTNKILCSNISQQEKNNAFNIFYDDLIELPYHIFEKSDFNEVILKYNLRAPKTFRHKNVKFKLTDINHDMYKPINPKTELFYVQTNYQFHSIKINNKHIYEKFSRNLDEPWREFLYLSWKNSEPYAIDGSINANKTQLNDWIKSWKEFQKKYPNFAKHEYVEELIKYYKSEIKKVD